MAKSYQGHALCLEVHFEGDSARIQPTGEAVFHVIIKLVQRKYNFMEITLLKKRACILRSSALWGLNVFLDDDGVVRVGGHLRTSHLPNNVKHPSPRLTTFT